MDMILLQGDDWCAVYWGGYCIMQDHSINFAQVMEHLVMDREWVESYSQYDVTEYGYDYDDPDAFPDFLNLEIYGKSE